MADKTHPATNVTAVAVELRPEARPTPEALVAPFAYVNAVRLGTDPFGITLSFFSIPADFAELPHVQEQLKAIQKNASPSAPGEPVSLAVAVQLPTVAKVWMPTDFIPELIQALSSHYSRLVQARTKVETQTKVEVQGGARDPH
jgi:hypothetical protein